MGYFSNGSDGSDYEVRWCAHCTHGEPGDGAGSCPVWLLHLLHNGQPGPAGAILDALIPRDLSQPGSPNGQCAMFVRDGQLRLPL